MASSYTQKFVVLFVGVLANLPLSFAQNIRYVMSQENQSKSIYLADSRKPALYTKEFGDCLGNSLINVTRFDVAYYKDNMTILFHLAGNSALTNKSLLMLIGVYVYGESRLNLTFNPCSTNVGSLCPLSASNPIDARGIIPISQSDLSRIPSIAFTIPDFEGNAVLSMFENATHSEIGCYTATLTNGSSFSHPASIGVVLGLFTFIAILTSFTTAICGDGMLAIRKHYAHSVSVLLVFAVFQHIFFTGAISLSWPSILVAWWSNFAWAGGMIYNGPMQSFIDSLAGLQDINASRTATTTSGSNAEHRLFDYTLANINSESVAHSRLHDTLRGNHSGFAGTLARENIAASNAFMTVFLWTLALVVTIVAVVVFLKWSLELLVWIALLKQERFVYFRAHWMGYTVQALLRALFIFFFTITALTLFQFSYGGARAILAIAAFAFLAVVVGMLYVIAYACYYRFRLSTAVVRPCRLHYKTIKLWNAIVWPKLYYASSDEDECRASAGSIPFWKIFRTTLETERAVFEGEQYVEQFGWLAARFRASRWWFFGLWLPYQFVEACFYGGGSNDPLVQVFGLLILEVLAVFVVAFLKPFEGQSPNALLVYLLSLSKICTVALCAAFDARFGLTRMSSTVIGIAIIILQGTLVICLLIAIIAGCASSYTSLTHNCDGENSRPRSWIWIPHRVRRLRSLGGATSEHSYKASSPSVLKSEERKRSSFKVGNVRRVAKIEDEDPDSIFSCFSSSYNLNVAVNNPSASFLFDVANPGAITPLSASPTHCLSPGRPSIRAFTGSDESGSPNVSYTSLPRAARVFRVSWSSREYLAARGTPFSAHPYSGYSYSGFQIRSPDPQYATIPCDAALCSRALDLELGGQSNSAPNIPTDLSADFNLASRELRRTTELQDSLDAAALTGSINFSEEQTKGHGVDKAKAITASPTRSKLSNVVNDKHVNDDNEDTMNGTTLFDDSNTSIPLRKREVGVEEELKPDDSLSNRASPKPIPLPMPRGCETSVRRHQRPEREQKNTRTGEQNRDGEHPQLLHRLSLGEAFTLDMLLPAGSSLHKNGDARPESGRT